MKIKNKILSGLLAFGSVTSLAVVSAACTNAQKEGSDKNKSTNTSVEAKASTEVKNTADTNVATTLSAEEQAEVDLLNEYLVLLANDEDGSKLAEVLKTLAQNAGDNTIKQGLAEDVEKVKAFFAYLSSKNVAITTKEQYDQAQLDDLSAKIDEFKAVLTKIYDAVFKYNVNRLSVNYQDAKTVEDLTPKAQERIDKYKNYRNVTVFKDFEIQELQEQKHKLDVYYDQLTTSLSDDKNKKEELFSSVAKFPYYKDNTTTSETVNAYMIITNLDRFDVLFKIFESYLKKMDDIKALAEKLQPWQPDVDGAAKRVLLNEKYGKYFQNIVPEYTPERLEADLTGVQNMYKWSQEAWKQMKAVNDQTTLEAFENLMNSYDDEKAKYDKFIEDLETAQQNVRKLQVIENSKTFKEQRDKFLDLVNDNSLVEDQKVKAALADAQKALYALQALYEDKDINNDDQKALQDTLARAYIDLVGPALYTVLPEADWGYDLIKELKTDIDRIWFYSNSIKLNWEKFYNSYKDALEVYNQQTNNN